MTDRETLEQQALQAVSAELYYDLADNIDEVSDEDLKAIIAGEESRAGHQHIWRDMPGLDPEDEKLLRCIHCDATKDSSGGVIEL